ncbi:hypothetical protein [Lyngbya sp. PCC 8106]|uniref:hypothetical protein n=1 Tax=Lyngbya sp. (strain PCC 8106) TaxID=313612 RepID=UPI0000EA8CCB|nr:hypothetical protein [Lyngbya sp. PCC 8106]EAW36248.1 hypothetical protein L8106_23001 [Lyngbya sp. PCC 8106]
MNIWIVTTGSSDVKLKTDENWGTLFRKVRGQFNKRQFLPTRPPHTDDDEPFIVPARAMGIVYGTQLTEEYYEDLHFPLLDAFSSKLLEKGKTYPDRIIVILTNQEVVVDKEDRKIEKSPYWQDTCTLKPIFAEYFQKNFPRVKSIDYLELKPKSKDEGLDNWDKALLLVQQALSSLDVDKSAIVYVSHQAGTPAISSAVQFQSLAKFGKKVEFLVSKEFEQELKKKAEIIESSTYLQGMQVQEAKALLKRYDYLGVKRILKPYWQSDPLSLEIRDLLAMAVQWNFAEFEEFGKARGEVAKDRLNNWWWTGYEAAYLGVIRLRQGNTIEALFHSFRAVEGLIKEWALDKYKTQIRYSNRNQPNTAYIHDANLPPNLRAWFNENKNDYNNVGLFGKSLFALLKVSLQNQWNQNQDIQVVASNTIDERNFTFHSLRGLQEEDVFQAWKTNSREKWESRVLGCLNFVSEQNFVSLKSASLMNQVHKELVDAIERYELQTLRKLS